MKAYWTAVSEDTDDLEANVISCIYREDTINIIFETNVDGDPVQGRLSIKPTDELQTVEGLWIYVDSIKEKPRFSEQNKESLETKYRATVTGKLHDFDGKSVNFEGTWDETKFHGNEGGIYNFEIDATTNR